MWGSSTQTHFRPNVAGKSHLKQKRKKNSNAPCAALGHFRWAPFFLYCQQIKSFRPTARTPAFIRFILFFVITFWQNWVFYVNRKFFQFLFKKVFFTIPCNVMVASHKIRNSNEIINFINGLQLEDERERHS